MICFHPTLLTSVVFLLYYINTSHCQMQMPMASFTDDEGTFAVYNGKVFQIPKKEEPGMFSGLFNFDLTDNALVRTIVGWTDYFSGSSSEPDLLESNSLSASQNAAQFAMPGQPLPPHSMNGFGYGDQKYPILGPGQGLQGNFYPRPPPPQWQQQQQPPKNFGNYPYNYKSQYPPRPVPSFQQMPMQAPVQAPVPPPPQFYPQPPQQAPLSPPSQVTYSQPLGDYESGPNYYSSPSIEFPEGQGNLDDFATNDNGQDAGFKRFYDSNINHEAMESNEIAEKSSLVAPLARQDMEMDVGADNPCPTIGQWRWDGTVCLALGPLPRWACRPNDLVSTGRVVVCRNKIWFPNDR